MSIKNEQESGDNFRYSSFTHHKTSVHLKHIKGDILFYLHLYIYMHVCFDFFNDFYEQDYFPIRK